MTEIQTLEVMRERSTWIAAGAPVPIEVTRSRYDDETKSWEVCWHDSLWDGKSGSSSPVAEFTTWEEAQHWAEHAARTLSTVYRLGRTDIVGPMPPGWWECAALGLDYYAGPPWPPLPPEAAARLRAEALDELGIPDPRETEGNPESPISGKDSGHD